MKVSVVIANHNYGRYIAQALRSILDQSMPKESYEVVVIDDGSTDLSLKTIEPYLDAVRLFTGEQQGHIEACNEGFQQSQGQYIVRLDADDYVNRDFLKIEALFLEENKGFDMVSCDYYKVDEKGERSGRYDANVEPIACGVMFRREVLFEEGLYGKENEVWSDTDFAGLLTKKGRRLYHIPLPLYRYRQHQNSLTKGKVHVLAGS